MSVSQLEEHFNSLFQQKYHKVVQLELEFNEEIPEKKKSEYDKLLQKALEFNPNEEKEPP